VTVPGDQIHGDPKPVGDSGSVALRDELTSEAADGREVEPDGRLQDQEREEWDDPETWK